MDESRACAQALRPISARVFATRAHSEVWPHSRLASPAVRQERDALHLAAPWTHVQEPARPWLVAWALSRLSALLGRALANGQRCPHARRNEPKAAEAAARSQKARAAGFRSAARFA